MSARAVAAFLAMFATTARAEPDDVHWLTYAALRNDVFTDLSPPIDDAGFTHDNVVSVRRTNGSPDGRWTFGGSVLDRWITSRVDQRRWDQVELMALGERALPHHLTAGGRLGPSFGGNFGGRKMQNGWHSISGTGPTLDEGLQSDYPADRRIGLVTGARLQLDVGEPGGPIGERSASSDGRTVPSYPVGMPPVRFGGYALVDGQVALHGGVSAVQVAVGGRTGVRHLVAHVELAATRYHVADPLLAIPGGYGTGFQLEWRAGVDLRWSRFQLGYEYRANEGGSGEPIGVVAFQSRR